MDVRAKIVDQVLESLPDLSADIRDRIERTLLTSLQGYEVQERCTDVTVHDNTNIGFVRKFIATKKLEGKSERTLRRYQPELEKLVSFLDKKFYEVSPYDLRLYLSLYKEQRQISNRTLENMRKTISTFFGCCDCKLCVCRYFFCSYSTAAQIHYLSTSVNRGTGIVA